MSVSVSHTHEKKKKAEPPTTLSFVSTRLAAVRALRRGALGKMCTTSALELSAASGTWSEYVFVAVNLGF